MNRTEYGVWRARSQCGEEGGATASVPVALLQHDFLQMHVIIPHINVKLRDVGIIAAIYNSPFVKAKANRQKNPEIN